MADQIDYQYIQRALKARQAAEQFQEQQAQRAEVARTKATQLEGQREYDRLVASGATPEQALRRTAGKLYYNNPEALARVLKGAGAPQEQMRMPIPTNYHGKPYLLTPSRYGYSPTAVPPAPANSPRNKMLQDEMQSVRRDIETREKAAMGIGPGLFGPNPAATNNVPQLRQRLDQLRQQIGGEEAPAPRSEAPATPFKEGQLIRNRRDGKLYRVQNGTPVLVE